VITLSNNELGAFKICAQRPAKKFQIAESMGISQTGASNIVNRLVEKGLCRRGDDGVITSGMEHAVALNSAIQDRTIPEWALVGGNLPILLSLLNQAKPMDRIAQEAKLALPTVKIYEWRMRKQALTIFNRNLELAPKNSALRGFLERYAHGCALHLAAASDSSSRVSWNDGLQFILRSEKDISFDDLRITGLSYLTNLGLQIGGWYRTYHHSFWNQEIGVEKACIDAHLNEPDSSTTISYCILTLMNTPFNRTTLLEEARYVGVDRLMNKVVKAAEGKSVDDPLIIPRSELEEMAHTFERRP